MALMSIVQSVFGKQMGYSYIRMSQVTESKEAKAYIRIYTNIAIAIVNDIIALAVRRIFIRGISLREFY